MGLLLGQKASGSLNHRLGRCGRPECSHLPQDHFLQEPRKPAHQEPPPTMPAAPRVLRGGDAVRELGPLLSVSLEAAIPAKSLWKRLCIYLAGMLVGLPTSVSLCVGQSQAWSWLQKVGALNLLQKTRLLCSRLPRGWRQRWKCSFPECTVQRARTARCRPTCGCETGRRAASCGLAHSRGLGWPQEDERPWSCSYRLT